MSYVYRCQSSSRGLVQDGPLVNARLFAPKPVIDSLPPQRLKVPKTAVTLMIDTGAARTAIDNALVSRLGLPPIRYDRLVGISQQPQECPVYWVDLRLDVTVDDKKCEYSFATEVLGVPPPNEQEPYKGFIGRDFLAHWHLTYDGPSGIVAMSIEE